MTRRLPLVVLVAAGALLIPATAAAKGPSDATITGPGLSSPLKFSGGGEGGNTALGRLVSWGGFFAQTFGQEPDPLLGTRPTGLLGPRYDVTYVVPGPSTDTLRQELYPYAVGGSFTYMEPRQKFWGDQRTHGGWYRGNPNLRSALVEAGLPKEAPAAHKRAAGSQRANSGRVIAISAGAGVVLAGAALLLFRRRR
jgi:hypothetical protein